MSKYCGSSRTDLEPGQSSGQAKGTASEPLEGQMVEMVKISRERGFSTLRGSFRGTADSGGDAHGRGNGSAAALGDPRPGAEPTPPVSAGFWAMLLRVAWLAILLGLLLQLALLLTAIGLGIFAGVRPLLADTVRNVAWSVLVCTGIALGRGASKSRMPLMGVTGLLAAPVALNVANMLQKGIAEALGVARPAGGLAPLGVMLIKAAEYGCLGAALGWMGRRAWGGALEHLGIGLVAGLVFGAAMLALAAQSAPKPLRADAFVVRGINELVFPVGCALAVYAAEVLGKHVRADGSQASQQPLTVTFANDGERYPFLFRVGVGSHPVTLTVGPGCNLNLGHWECATHRRGFATRHRRERHTRHGKHRLIWMCWAHGPEQPRADQLRDVDQGLADPAAAASTPSQPPQTDLGIATVPSRHDRESPARR
jgi:hypothetical protein